MVFGIKLAMASKTVAPAVVNFPIAALLGGAALGVALGIAISKIEFCDCKIKELVLNQVERIIVGEDPDPDSDTEKEDARNRNQHQSQDKCLCAICLREISLQRQREDMRLRGQRDERNCSCDSCYEGDYENTSELSPASTGDTTSGTLDSDESIRYANKTASRTGSNNRHFRSPFADTGDEDEDDLYTIPSTHRNSSLPLSASVASGVIESSSSIHRRRLLNPHSSDEENYIDLTTPSETDGISSAASSRTNSSVTSAFHSSENTTDSSSDF